MLRYRKYTVNRKFYSFYISFHSTVIRFRYWEFIATWGKD